MINIEDDIFHLQRSGLLGRLLYDRTTKKNIIWATDAHAQLGMDFGRDKEIRTDLITGDYSGIIKTRASKALNAQNDRTKQHGEVFTPMWVCKKMNDYADEEWFGVPDVFDTARDTTYPVQFSEGRTWQSYVDSRRMEITCGEAPYLVSRYDVATGEEVPIDQRIGILDRKLRIVGENAGTEEEWLKWTFRAFEATYGYEFQGDNLLIARINVLMTFTEYLNAKWHREPTGKEYERLIKIVTWNLWQMDGLTGAIPYAKAQEDDGQLSVWDFLDIPAKEEKTQPNCRIYDWRANRSVEYNSLKREK